MCVFLFVPPTPATSKRSLPSCPQAPAVQGARLSAVLRFDPRLEIALWAKLCLGRSKTKKILMNSGEKVLITNGYIFFL